MMIQDQMLFQGPNICSPQASNSPSLQTDLHPRNLVPRDLSSSPLAMPMADTRLSRLITPARARNGPTQGISPPFKEGFLCPFQRMR